MPTRFAASLLLVLLPVGVTRAQVPLGLGLAFEKALGVPRVVDISVRHVVRSEGRDFMDLTCAYTLALRWKERPGQGGDRRFTRKVERIQAEIKGADRRFRYDSALPPPPGVNNPLADALRPLVGRETTFRVSPQGEAEPVAPAAPPNDIAKEVLALLDDAPCLPFRGKGDTWQRKATARLFALGELESDTRFTTVGREGGLERVAVEGPVKHIPANPPAFPFGPAKLRVAKAHGTLFFDPTRGLLEHGEFSLQAEGKVAVDAGSRPLDIGFSHEQTVKVRTSRGWK